MKFLATFAAVNSFSKCKIFTAAAKLAFTLLLLTTFAHFAPAQRQPAAEIDHLTKAEDDLIHETQELDKRTEIFVKAIDRRLIILNPANEPIGVVKASKETRKKDKDADKWGEPPTGTRAELLADVKSILDEAVRNIDNAAEHNAKSALVPKALKQLADGCSRFTAQLKPFSETAQSERERGDIYDAAENCREVIEASAQHGVDPVK